MIGNLPPGITESMIPGCGTYLHGFVAEDFVELDYGDWLDWGVFEGDGACERCGVMIGAYFPDLATDPHHYEWTPCWLVAELTVCADCRAEMLEDDRP